MNPYLLRALRMTPTLLAEAFDRIDPAALDVPTDLDRFTPREILAHMADWEPVLLARMKQATTAPGTAVQAFDEGQMAVDGSYGEWDPKQSLGKFMAARETTVNWLESLTRPEWDLTILHPERGVLPVHDMANTLVCHDIYHIEQIAQLARTPV